MTIPWSIAQKFADITHRAGALVQSFQAACQPNAEGLSFNHRASDAKYFDLYFFLQSWEALNIYSDYSIGAHAATTLWTCQYTWRWELLWCKVPNFTPSIFSIQQILPTSEICFCCSVRYFLLLHCKVSHHAGNFPECIGPMNFLTEVPRALIFKNYPEPGHSWTTFLQQHVVCTPQNPHSTYSTIFVLVSILAFTQLHSIWAALMLPLSSHCTHSVSPRASLCHTHAAALMQQQQEDIMLKKPKDPRDGVTVRVSIEIWYSCIDFCNIVYMQKVAAQQDALAQCFFGTVRGAKLLHCSKWIFSFCTKFSSCPFTQGENPVCPL